MTPQEWQTLLVLYENRQLTQRVFCEKQGSRNRRLILLESSSLETFFSKYS